MCPLPNEAVPAEVEVTTKHWLAQLERALPASSTADILTLYHNGNFFSDKEVPPERREAIYRYLFNSSIQTLVVESLPQFITEEKICHAHDYLREGQRIEVAIGLQSTDAFLRNVVLASSCTQESMDRALRALRSCGDCAQVFLMYQMPFLTVAEAAFSLEQSILELQEFWGITDPTLCAMRIAPHTVVAELYGKGGFKLGTLWSLVQVLHAVRLKKPENKARVAVSLLQRTSSQEPTTDACPDCRDKLLGWIGAYNRGALEPMPVHDCNCAQGSGPIAYRKERVLKRIEQYLSAD